MNIYAEEWVCEQTRTNVSILQSPFFTLRCKFLKRCTWKIDQKRWVRQSKRVEIKFWGEKKLPSSSTIAFLITGLNLPATQKHKCLNKKNIIIDLTIVYIFLPCLLSTSINEVSGVPPTVHFSTGAARFPTCKKKNTNKNYKLSWNNETFYDIFQEKDEKVI